MGRSATVVLVVVAVPAAVVVAFGKVDVVVAAAVALADELPSISGSAELEGAPRDAPAVDSGGDPELGSPLADV